MILTTNKQTEVLGDGVLETKKMTIDESDKAVLMMILSQGLYQDAVGSLLREAVTNSIDSHAEAGIREPVLLNIKDENGEPVLNVQDFGVGLSPQRIEDIFSKYAASTKRERNDQYGCFGLGSKAPLAYRDNFFIISRYNTVEYTYVMHKGEEGTELALIKEEFTSEPNGVTIKVPLKNRSDIREFADSTKYQMCYFEDVFIDIPGVPSDFNIVKSQDWKWSSLYPGDEMHLCLDNVYYPLDWKALKIAPIELPVGLNFSVSDGITPTPNRENILMTPTTRAAILAKIKAVCTWFAEEYNKKMQFTSFQDILDYEEYFNMVQVGPNAEFSLRLPVKEINAHSDIQLSKPNLSYAPDLDMENVLEKSALLLANLPVIKLWDGSDWRKRSQKGGRRRGWSVQVSETLPLGEKAIIVPPNHPTSAVNMAYIKDTHDRVYIIHETFRHSTNPNHDLKQGMYWSYFTAGTHTPEKEEQLKAICHELLEMNVTHYDDIQPTEDWLRERKEKRAKTTRVKKEKAQIFPKFGRVGGFDDERIIYDDRKLVELTEVKPSMRVVYGTEDEKELLLDAGKILHSIDDVIIVSALLSKQDEKRLLQYDLKNWVKVTDFMSKKNKVLSRYLTASRIEQLQVNNQLLFGEAKVISPKLKKDIKELKGYMHDIMHNSGNKYRKFQASDELMKELMTAAIENNWWDSRIVGKIEEIEKELPLLDDLDVLSNSTDTISGNSVEKPKILKIMRQLYTYRKLKQAGKIKL